MRVSPLVFDRAFGRFKKQVRNHPASGEEFRSFQEGLPERKESYKEQVRYEALRRLNVGKWTRAEVGKGRILNRVIAAIEINESRTKLRNNLVAWPNKRGYDQLSHRALLDAKRDSEARRRFELWFFRFFRGESSDAAAFEQFREIAGNRYDLVAYLFFLKDWTRFMPIAPKTFDAAFALLGVDLVTWHHCSWENYHQFNDTLRSVQRHLRDVAGQATARLIDAHSFCWMLIDLSVGPPRKVHVPLPKLITKISPALPEDPTRDNAEEFDELDDDWFSARSIRRRRLGKLAQGVALASERARLKQAGHPDPETATQPVWNEPGRGYDILSEEVNKAPRHIEVKAARRNGTGWVFFVSANELRAARRLPNYWFYLVSKVESDHPIVEMVAGKAVSQRCLTATNYRAAFNSG